MSNPGAEPARKILGLFPELLGVGGVQEAGRLTALAVARIAGRREWRAEFLSLNDPAGEHAVETDQGTIPVRGFGRRKAQFVQAAIARARDGARIAIAGHPNLALPAACAKFLAPNLQFVAMSHGVEVWKRLPMVRRRALAAADLALAPSRDTAAKLVAIQSVPEKKVRRLAWPLNPSFLRLAEAPQELRLPRPFPTGRVILTVGRWDTAERYKGADQLIQATAQLRSIHSDLQLLVVGSGSDVPRLQELARQLEVTARVHFRQGLSREELAACYFRSDIFALPSTGEGFGIVYLEAMAFAKPVVGAACGGSTDLIEDGTNGLLVAPRDTAALAAALERLLENEALRRELGRRGGEIVRERYAFEAFETGFEQLLRGCGLDSEGGR
jgi:phosphatidyl-myo-inositol dimannoside synthase